MAMQQPMQQPMAGGIASVLGKPPGNPGAQAQPMVPQIGNQPGPVPMGVGSVDARAAEFMNKPQELQKRYGMTQDTFDLMALMKIKKEKEMAARQMQLQMAQQDAQTGQPPQTVKERMEQEVHELTKNELADQAGDTLKQQFETKQANLQRVAQGALPPSAAGIAAAPGAQAAAQPKAMAAGGIVAFAGDDPEVGSLVPEATEEDPEFDENGNPRPAQERIRIAERNAQLRRNAESQAKIDAARGNKPTLGPYNTPQPAPGAQRMAEFYKPRNPAAATAPPPQVPAPGLPGLRGPTAEGVRQHQVGNAGVTPNMPADVAGILAAPGAGGRAGAGAAVSRATTTGAAAPGGINEELRRIQMEEARRDPEAQRLKEEERIRGLLSTEKDEAQRRAYIDEQRALMKEEFDPARLREQGLIRFLTGAGGRAYGELGAGAMAGMSYDEAQRANKLKRLEGLQGKEEGIQALRRKAMEDSIAAGKTAYEAASGQKRVGITAATDSERTDIASRDKALDREIERLKVQAQREHTAAMKEGNDFAKLQATITSIQSLRERAIDSLDKKYKGPRETLAWQLQAKPNDPALQKQKQVLEAQYEAEVLAKSKEFDERADEVRAKLYGSSNAPTSGYTVKKKEPTR